MRGKACSVVGEAVEYIALTLNACPGILGSLMGEQQAQPGQAFQSLGEELSTADRDVAEGAQGNQEFTIAAWSMEVFTESGTTVT